MTETTKFLRISDAGGGYQRQCWTAENSTQKTAEVTPQEDING